jgi:hypothetical protein
MVISTGLQRRVRTQLQSHSHASVSHLLHRCIRIHAVLLYSSCDCCFPLTLMSVPMLILLNLLTLLMPNLMLLLLQHSTCSSTLSHTRSDLILSQLSTHFYSHRKRINLVTYFPPSNPLAQSTYKPISYETGHTHCQDRQSLRQYIDRMAMSKDSQSCDMPDPWSPLPLPSHRLSCPCNDS